MSSLANAPRASLGRRMAAWVYDFMVALAVYMLAGAVLFALFTALVSMGLVDKGGMTHTVDVLQSSPVWLTLNEIGKLLAVAWLFVWSWKKKGQTLGMRAWRLRVQRTDGSELDARQAWLRVAVSFGGLAMLSLLWDDEGTAMNDRISGSEVVVLTVEQNRDLMERQ